MREVCRIEKTREGRSEGKRKVGRKGEYEKNGMQWEERGKRWMQREEELGGRKREREKGGTTEKQGKNTSSIHTSSNAPAHFVSAFCIIFLNCFPGSVLASSFMVATSVGVIRSRNESM